MAERKRLVAWFLTILMVMQMLPINALAEAGGQVWKLATFSNADVGSTTYVVNFVGPDGTIVSTQLVAEGESVDMTALTEEYGNIWKADDYQNIRKNKTVYPTMTGETGKAIVGVYLNGQFVKHHEVDIKEYKDTNWYGTTTYYYVTQASVCDSFKAPYDGLQEADSRSDWRFGTSGANISNSFEKDYEWNFKNYNSGNTYYIAPNPGSNDYKYYTVTFVYKDANGAQLGTKAQIVRYGQRVNVPALDGYSQNEYQYEFTAPGKINRETVVNITVKGNPVASFMADETTLFTSVTASVSNRGFYVNEPDTQPKRDGYVFDGWTRAGGELAFQGYYHQEYLNDDTTFYAKWTKLLTVTFKEDTGAEAGNFSVVANVRENTRLERLPEGNPTKENYLFGGWASSATPTTPFDFSTQPITEETTTFVPLWLEAVTVRFLKNAGDTEAYATKTFEKGKTIPEMPKDPTQTGKAFCGWADPQNPTVKVEDIATTAFEADATFVAIWKDAVTITFKVDGKEYSKAVIGKGETLEGRMPQNPAKEGAIFDGWAYEGTQMPVENIGSMTFETDATFVPVWKQPATASFVDGRTTIAAYTVPSGRSVTAPEAPAKEGYAFLGWATTADGEAAIQAGATLTVTQDVTYYAVYKPRVTVRFINAAGKVIETQTHIKDELLTMLAMPENGNYVPLGWTTQAYPNGVVPYAQRNILTIAPNSDYTVTGDVDFYATYREKNAIFYDAERKLNYGVFDAEKDTINMPASPAYDKSAYLLVGWTTRTNTVILEPGDDPAQYVAASYEDGETYSIVLQKKSFEVTFMDGGTEVAKLEYAYGSPVGTPEIVYNEFEYEIGSVRIGSIEYPEKTFTFVGWTPTILSVTQNATVFAQFEQIELADDEHLVIFLDEEGHPAVGKDGTPIQIQKVKHGERAEYPGEAKIGAEDIEFRGWYRAENIPWNFDDPVTENLVLTANVKHDYLVQFFVDGNQIAYANVKKGGKANSFDPTGKVQFLNREFLGWREKDAQDYFDFDAEITRDVQLHAHISDLRYVRYETYSTPIKPFKYVVDQQTAYEGFPAAPARTGYSFRGWSFQPDTEEQTQATTRQVQEALANGDVQLYAMWTGEIVPVTVVYWRQKNKQDREGSSAMAVENYNYAETKTAYARAGEKVTFDLDKRGFDGLYSNRYGSTAYTYIPSDDSGDYAYFKLADVPEIVVKPTGTIINVFYNRKTYTLWFNLVSSSDTMTFNGTQYKSGEYTITAELDEDIAARWPDYSEKNLSFTGDSVGFYAWDKISSTSNSLQVTKLLTMTSDACKRASYPGYVTARVGGDRNYYLFYMFESLKNEPAHKSYGPRPSRNYTVNEGFSQLAWASAFFGDKVIVGMEFVDTEKISSNDYSQCGLNGYPKPEDAANAQRYQLLYYKRNRHTIKVDLNDAEEINHAKVPATLSSTATGYGTAYDKQTTAGAGNNNSTTYTISSIPYGEKISWFKPKDPTREGCRFLGWYADPGCNEPIDFGKATLPDDNFVMYAKWQVKPVNVTYYLSESAGESVYENSTISWGQNAPEILPPSDDPTRGQFEGWYYKPFEDSSLTEKFVPGETTVMKDTVVYAKWKTLGFNVTYDPNNGERPWNDEESYDLGQEMLIGDIGERTNGNLVFVGWKEEFFNRILQPGDTYFVFFDVTFKAIWVEPSEVNKVIYHSNYPGSTAISTQYVLENRSTVARSGRIFGREGYNFAYWTTEPNGTGTRYNPGSYIGPNVYDESKEFHLYAQWERAEGKLTIEKIVELSKAVTEATDFPFTFKVTNRRGRVVAEPTVTVTVPANGTTGRNSAELTLDVGTYTIEETNSGDVWTTTVDGATTKRANAEITTSETDGDAAVTFTNRRATANVIITKNWEDNNDQDGKRPAKSDVTVTLTGSAAGETYSFAVSGDQWQGEDNADSWSAEIAVPTHTLSGARITYAVAENVTYAEGAEYASTYPPTFMPANVKRLTLTNTREPETITIEGSKTWVDGNNEQGKRPGSITIRLMANGEEKASQVVQPDESGNWAWSFESLPKYAGGREITYAITEDTVTGYTVSIGNYNVTNALTDSKDVSVTGTKTWIGDAGAHNNQNEVQLTLTAKRKNAPAGTAYAPIDPQPANQPSWNGDRYTYSNLPRYDGEGYELVYDVVEATIPGYSSVKTTVNGEINFTNTKLYTIEVIKAWNELGVANPTHPTVTIHLTANETGAEVLRSATLGADGSVTFADVPYNANGYVITETLSDATYYTETRATVTAAELTAAQNARVSVTITNTRKSGGELRISKTLDAKDVDSTFGELPESFTFTVTNTADGTSQPVTLNLNSDKTAYESQDLGSLTLGATYAVTENVEHEGVWTATANDTTAPETDAKVTIAPQPDGENTPVNAVTFTNTRDLYSDGTITAAKAWNVPAYVTDTLTASFQLQYSTNGGTSWTDYGDARTITYDRNAQQPQSVEWANMPATTTDGKTISYRVVETVTDGDTTPDTATVSVDANGDASFTNTFKTTDKTLTVSKTVVDNTRQTDKSHDIPFTMTLTRGDTAVAGVAYTVRSQGTEVRTGNTGANGEFTLRHGESAAFTGLAYGTYTVTEALDNAKVWTQTVGNNAVTIDSVWTGAEVAFTNTLTATNVAVRKVWANDAGFEFARPDMVFNLYAKVKDSEPARYVTSSFATTGEKTAFEVYDIDETSASDDNTFENLPKYRIVENEGGTYAYEEIIYSVEEALNTGAQDTGYVYEPTTALDGVTLVFTNTLQKQTLTINKTVNMSGVDEDAPASFTFTVANTANGKDTHSVTVTKQENGTYAAASIVLPKDATYRVTEASYTVDGQTVNFSGNVWTAAATGLTQTAGETHTGTVTMDGDRSVAFANTRRTVDGGVVVTKNWNDNSDQDGKRPAKTDFTVTLDGDGTGTAAAYNLSVSGDDWNGGDKAESWTTTIASVPTHKLNGDVITYSVSEAFTDATEAAAYSSGETDTASIIPANGERVVNLTNTHTPGKITISVTKEWNDDNDADGLRPASVTLGLFKATGTTALQEVTVDDQHLTQSFTEVDEYENGSRIVYTVKEKSAAGAWIGDNENYDKFYTMTLTSNGTSFTVKNTYTAIVRHVSYAYEGALAPAGADALLPPGADYHVGTQVQVSASDPSLEGYTFTGWHTSEETGDKLVNDDTTSFIMPDEDVVLKGSWAEAPDATHTLTVTKEWKDLGVNPTSRVVEFELMRKDENGAWAPVADQPKKSTTETRPTVEFTGLPKYDYKDNEAYLIEYAVVETDVANYTPSYAPESVTFDTATKAIEVTNTRDANGQLRISKTLDAKDVDSEFGELPESFTFTVTNTADGTSQTVTLNLNSDKTAYESQDLGGLTLGATYTVTENVEHAGVWTATANDTTAPETDAKVTIEPQPDGETAPVNAVTFTNTRDLYSDGTITAAKAWNVPAYVTDTLTASFQLQYSTNGGTSWTDYDDARTITYDRNAQQPQSVEWGHMPATTTDGKTISYQVVETVTAGDTTPDTATVQVNANGDASFTNTFNETEADLTVTKSVTDASGQRLSDEIEFTMQLTRGNEPMKNYPYTVDGEQRSTDEYGQFKLRDGQRAVFKNLAYGSYEVIETGHARDIWTPAYQDNTATIDANWAGQTVTVTNTMATAEAMQVQKAWAGDEDYMIARPDVTFNLYATVRENDGTKYVTSGYEAVTEKTPFKTETVAGAEKQQSQSGVKTFGSLPAYLIVRDESGAYGYEPITYSVEETMAANGYTYASASAEVNGVTVYTNTLETMDVAGEKVWDAERRDAGDVSDGDRAAQAGRPGRRYRDDSG